ncbi:hypothetical protein QFC21_005296 [Naganishia friedmannii]|uniref:Uncharacterized protein n=1 Tax=Naganishia friedmannii TaxID=89922 RepID=A0ACC2VAU2_9TREE|nr:hypothetical protein QFC21_005296 [Naganishia friedmannii]
MFDPATPPSNVSRALPSRRCTDISEWADDVSELAYMNPYPSTSGTYFHHPGYDYLSCPATPASSSNNTSTTYNYLPQRTTSLSPTSLPLAKSPLPLLWAEATDSTLLPTPKRPAPLPPLHSRSRSRSRTNTGTQTGRKWRMTLVDPEQVGLWTLREDAEGQYDDALPPSPAPTSKQQEGHMLWGDSKREKGTGYDETVPQMTRGADQSAWVAPETGEGAGPIGLGLGLDDGIHRSTPRSRQIHPRPERQFDGLFYVSPVSNLPTSALLTASNAGGTGRMEGEATMAMLESPMSSEESWGNLSAAETTPIMPSPDDQAFPLAFPAFVPFAEPRPVPPRPLRITTTPIPGGEDGKYDFPTFPDLELGSPFTPMPMMTPCRPHTGVIGYTTAQQEEEHIVSPLEGIVGGRKRVTSAPAVIHWPEWSSASSESSVSHSHTSSASSFLSSEGPITPPITAFQMQRVEKRESVVGEDLLEAFEKFLMEAHEPTHAFLVDHEQGEKALVGGDATVQASPRTPPPKRAIKHTNQPPAPPATPMKKRHTARVLQNHTPVPRSCEALQFVITTNTAEEARRVPQTAPCFGGNGRDLVFDFRVVETGRERGVETCRASLVRRSSMKVIQGRER